MTRELSAIDSQPSVARVPYVAAVLIIALITVSLQSVRAALADPVDSLKYE